MGASFQRFMLFVFGALISGANASAQCSFNYELYFDPQVFPDYSSGYDGNNYADEAAALMAAKFAYFGPTATYATQPVTQVCKGANISVELSMVQGGGPGEIHFWGSGTYPLSNFSGSSILQITAVRGFCTGGVMTGTRQEVYAPGYVLTCKHLVLPNLSLIGASEVRPTGTGGTSIITFTAKTTTPNGQPKAGVALNFSADVKAYSGGHEHHDATREKGTVTPTQGVTNAAGELVVKFAAPKAAGTHTIKATCASCSNKEVSKEIQVKVPGLIELLADTEKPTTYVLVGNAGYPGENHKSNHWFTPESVVALDKVTRALFKGGWGTVGVNDGSLPWGGLFDIYGRWAELHKEHRMGTEVDVSFSNPRAISDEKKQNAFDMLCAKENSAFGVQTLWHQNDGGQPHFHIYLRGAGITSEAGGGPCCTQYQTVIPIVGKDGKTTMKKVNRCLETTAR